VFETYWTNGRGVEAMDNSNSLLDRTVYGRQEIWEDSPAGWPRRPEITGEPHSYAPRDAQSSSGPAYIHAGRSDDLGTAGA